MTVSIAAPKVKNTVPCLLSLETIRWNNQKHCLGNQTFYGGDKARQARPFVAIFDLKQRAERTANQGLQRARLIPNFQSPARSQSAYQWNISLCGKKKTKNNFLHDKKTNEPAERRAKTRRSPSLMSSKTLQPSQVTLGFWIEPGWELFWGILILYWTEPALITEPRIKVIVTANLGLYSPFDE